MCIRDRDSTNQVIRTTPGVFLNSGDEIKLTGSFNVWEYARLDYVEWAPDILSGGIYKIKNLDSGKYLDTGADGTISLASNSIYDDQDWIVSLDASGYWTIENARTGRYYLDTETINNSVIYNSGEITDESLWSLEKDASGGYRINNKATGRDYMYATSADELKWNTGSTDSSTIWVFE